ncbi:MAG TPA: flippase activity-associated protein Agl23, partial [Thermomicrobiales bacterium]|nr:flippase activity-associated protein Agl23 [Thermomicrobiales bacterium]
SWVYETGGGYRHDPLMHGPLLFHLDALAFLLFGDSNASSRYMPAIFGVALVALPYLLRSPNLLGRWGALTASFFFLISPVLLYQSRYIRHDIFTVAGALLLFIAIVRYVDRPQRRWLVTMGITLGFLLANHEIIFGIAAIFVAVIAGALFFGPLRRAGLVAIVTAIAALAVLRIVPRLTDAPLPPIPWQHPTQADQRDFYVALLTNPLILSLLAVAIVGIAAIAFVIIQQYGPQRPAEGWIDRIFGGGAEGSVQEAMRTALHDRQGLWLAFGGLTIVFAFLFTTMFTNLYGLASGTISTDGTLLYWLGQHDYRRGEQPWFYYMLLFPQYEFIAVLLGTAMAAFVAVRAVLVALGRAAMGPRFFTQTLLAFWYGGIFVALSWAGEKMPWLVVHIALPALLLAAALLGELAERWRPAARDLLGRARLRAGGWGWPEWAVTTALLLAGACWLLLAGRLTYGEFITSTDPGGWTRTLPDSALALWWLLAVPPAIALAVLIVGLATRGARRTGEAALVALVAALAFLQIHTAWRLTYLEGDVPKDMLVYTQTSPDVTRVVDELTALSETMTGGKGLEIWYDDNNGVSWPMQWYLRDFPNRHLYGSSLTTTPTAPIVLAGGDNVGAVQAAMQGYTAQPYVLRWWFPEEIYR